MSTHGKQETVALTNAAEDMDSNQYFAVAINGTRAATPTAAFGISLSKVGTGQNFTVGVAGVFKAYAGAVINSGSLIGPTTSGWMIATSVASTGIVGRSIAQAASGDLFECYLDFASP